MANNIRDSGRARGRPFKPREPYTQRLRKILEEYPDGSQILREILQNSDDAKSSHQIFILDHNTYSSNKLFEPELNGYSRTNLKLDRYQGPALLALNNTIFEERDFQSLLKLADSEKRDQFDKIGVMGVGFNSIYHITDSPSFITGDKYVILDPHEWYFSGGVQFDFVDDNLAQTYPDQFAPFVIPSVNISYNRSYEGTIFRYPLRTKQDSIDSDISKKIYSPQEILDTFYNFYKNESTNSILFLKYIEKITFFELKQGAAEPNFLFTIELTNANEVREQRRLIAENIVPMMNSLTSKEQSKKELVTSYVASFGRQRGNSDIPDENSSWLILNYLDDLQETEKHFKNKFEKNIADYKFVPNVGLAVNLNALNAVGRLFCFLPLPISMPFSISVNGYFAVSTNRRSLWTVADNEDLAADAIARLKVSWNQYLFENVLPKAWVRFLRELPFKVPKIQSGDMYKFWPISMQDTGSMSNFCKDLLKNVIENLGVKDKVFEGPSLTNSVGTVSTFSVSSYEASVFEGSEFYWLSLSNGFFDGSSIDASKIIQKIGFPVISTPLTHHSIIEFIKASKLKHSLTLLSPDNVRDYLKKNIDRWQDKMSRSDVLQVFKYVFTDKNFDKLEGFKIIPLANDTLGTLTKYSDSYIYIGPYDNSTITKNDEFHVFKDHLNRFVDKNIDPGLYKSFYSMTASTWNLNIKVLDALDVIGMIKFTLKSENVDSEEMQISKHYSWIQKLWENLNYRRWDLKEFENVHLIPTSRNTLRKLKTPKKAFLNHSTTYLKTIFEKFGAVFVDSRFEKTAELPELSPYIIKPDDMILVLKSFQADTSYPNNLNHKLQVNEATALLDHLSNYFRVNYKIRHLSKFEEVNEVIEVIKHLPIFTEVDNTSKISLLPDLSENKTKWFLLPRYEENTYGKIICPSDKGRFLNSSSQNLRYILEDMIKIPRLDSDDYWLNYVIPFLESQRPADRDVVIDKLFEHDNLKSSLMNISFVPIGTFGMSKNLQLPINVRLVKPSDLFDPEEKALVDLFFEDEQFFPTGNYGISKELPSKKFLLNLRLLGMKSILSSNDVVSRIQTIVARKQNSKFHVNSIRIHALKLFKYLDDNWSKLTENDDQEFLNAILENEWIPTIDKAGKEIFSKPQDCYCQKVKYLVCFVAPIFEFNAKNEEFSSLLKWNTYPEATKVLKQLELCYDCTPSKRPPNFKEVCNAIYEYMNKMFRASDGVFELVKESLENKPWILCGKTFYCADQIVFKLPHQSNLNSNDFLIVEFPAEYPNKLEPFFKAMGVRDVIGVKDFILIITNKSKGNLDRELSTDEIEDIVQILEQIATIQQDAREGRKYLEKLDGLLVPSTKNKLVNYDEIQYDDMKDRIDEREKSKYQIAHHLITREVVKELGIETLTGKIYGHGSDDINWDIYEQDESLTTRIKNIIKDYPLEKLFIEFLQNADDAKAKRFSIIIDERPKLQHDCSKKTLLSDEMDDWQGPSIWIYNDAEFSDHDFMALIKLGVGGKSHDNTKIGRFGIGFNSSFHVTDLPSIVSGKYIAFLDPNAKFLPTKKHRGTRFNFIEKEFKKRIPDQCFPYKALEGCDFIKDCSFTKEFKGTLFRLPLRTQKLAEMSDISNRVIDINEISKLFSNVQGSKEMLFLRNIESCSMYRIDKNGQAPQMIWQTQINNMSETIRDIRKSVIAQEQTYKLEIERTNEQNQKSSEIWLLCTGEHESVKSEFEKFSNEKRLKPRGGVAALLAKSDEKCLDELKAESFSNPPKLQGEMFSYLPLSVGTNLGVHLSGNFSLSSARSNILHDFLEAETDDARWNRYILCDILPELHAKLIDQVVIQLIEAKLNREQTNVMPHHLWPIKKDTTGTYKDYGLNVIKRLGLNGQKVLWTEANGGQFVSLQSAKIINEDEPIVADILAKLGVLVVKLDKVQLQQLEEIKELNLQYTILNGKLTCEELQRKKLKLPSLIKEQTRDSLFKLLKFVLEDQSSYNFLNGLSLVPLSGGSVGTFGDGQYVGEKAHLALFPKIGPSKFIIDLSDDFSKIFTSKEFSEATRIKKFDASAILDLLSYEIPLEDIDWDPKGKLVPNKPWLEAIWSILTKEAGNVEFDKLSLFPLLSMTKPSDKLIKPNPSNPLLHDNGHFLIPILVKLKVRFTDMKVFESDEKLEQCILECNPINIINSLAKTCSSLSLNMKELFENSKLTSSEYKKFREFLISEQKDLIDHGIIQEDFLSIRSSLPIWPIQNCEDKFIDAKSGILLPFELPFFTFSKNTNFYKCEFENENLALVSLNAKVITELQYVKKYLLPDFEIHSIPKDCEGYIPLLKKLLSLKNFDIEYLLKNKKVIPNKSLSAFVSANELYDKNVSIFGSIFEDSDKFLPTELLQDSVHLDRLKRIGLKHQMNYDTFIECTQEIVLQITNRVDSARNRAKILVRYLYEHVDNLRFNPGQWDEILEIKFVPSEISEASLSRQFYKMPKETTGFESFRTLRLHKYKNVCWTRCPLFDENLEPTAPFNKRHPEIGIPTPEDIMEHWFVVVDKIEIWKTFKGDKEIKDVIKEIYEKMDHHSKDEKHKLSIQLNIDNDKRKLFLNKKEDPFDPNNWAFGKDLVFDLEDDVREVSEWLKPFKPLLLLGGAQEVKGLEKSNNVTEHKQNKFLINALLNKLTDKSGHELYDVFFIVGKEKERIGANRFVLSAASAYFEKMFCGNFSESAEKVIEIPMIDENIQPEVFKVFLRWLYGQRLVEAIKSVLRKKEEFTNEQESYETYYLDSLVHLLKVTDIYGVEPLKDEIVNIIKHDCIRICNVLEIKEWAINCNAPRLTESCKEYIRLNERLVLEQNKENCAMAEDED